MSNDEPAMKALDAKASLIAELEAQLSALMDAFNDQAAENERLKKLLRLLSSDLAIYNGRIRAALHEGSPE